MSGVIVAGMHRSGTSVTARLIADGGWHPGESVLASATEEFLEDESFVGLHRNWIESHLPSGDGHLDWGISDGGRIDLGSLPDQVFAGLVARAREFVDRRDGEQSRWIAKDPRASLFLPVWGEIDTVHFVLVYRNPWDVVDSAVRLGSDTFCRRPRLALRAWFEYNRCLVSFARSHRNRCFILAAERLISDLPIVWSALNEVLDLEGGVPNMLLQPDRFVHRDDHQPIAALYEDAHPSLTALLAELDDMADFPRIPTAGSRVGRLPGALPGGTLPAGRGVQVIVPCRNDGDFLLEAVASVDDCANRVRLDTGEAKVELTVVDDGSTDPETLRILNALRAGARQVLVTQGIGLAAARNLALGVSSTRAVIPLDADNRLLMPLVEALESLENDRADLIHGPWQRFGMDSAHVVPPVMQFDSLVPTNTIDACALVSRELLGRLGGWDAELPFWEDWDLWLGAIKAGARVGRVENATFAYLVRPGSLSTRPKHDLEARARVVAHVTDKHAGLFGPVVRRLVTQVHQLDIANTNAEIERSELEFAYQELEAHHLRVFEAYRSLEHAYRALEALHLAREGGG